MKCTALKVIGAGSRGRMEVECGTEMDKVGEIQKLLTEEVSKDGILYLNKVPIPATLYSCPSCKSVKLI